MATATCEPARTEEVVPRVKVMGSKAATTARVATAAIVLANILIIGLGVSSRNGFTKLFKKWLPTMELQMQAKVASMIKGKNTEEIRKQFNIVNDFTPEEEAQVREENRWCEEHRGDPEAVQHCERFHAGG